MGDGFKLTRKEYNDLIDIEPTASDLIKSLLGGADITDDPNHMPSRFVIDTEQMTEDEVKNYSTVYQRLRDMVYPSRSIIKDEAKKKYWWRFAGSSFALYKSIKNYCNCIACSRVATHVSFAIVPTINKIGPLVFDESIVVIAFEDMAHFGILQSTHHLIWVEKWGSRMGNAPRYTATEVLETFPFPNIINKLEIVSSRYYETRCQLMQTRQEGLTKTYNRFHDPKETAADIIRLRRLHIAMDYTVAKAYGWSDLKLQHGFHETKQGVHYTISEAARREVLDRLLRLNHERYAEEVRQGLHDKKGGKAKVQRDEAVEDGETFSLEAGATGTKRRGRRRK